MNVLEEIEQHIAEQPEAKRTDIRVLHTLILQLQPNARLWFDDGKNSENRTVTNPTIGYGFRTIKYADGKTKDFFQIGLSSNKTGISIYIIGIKDKTYLAQNFAKELGKAKVTGYCIKFNSLAQINLNVLETTIQYGFEVTKTE